MTTYRLYDGASGRPGFGSSGTQPPSAGTAFSGNYIAGLVFSVTSGGLWFQGYQWLVCASGQDTSGWKFALWSASGNTTTLSKLVSGSVVTGGTLTAGQFNFVQLTTPLLLTPNVPYLAQVGKNVTTGFPDTLNQYLSGSGDPYPNGVTSGPLSLYASGSTGVMSDIVLPQSPFTTTQGADPSAGLANTNNHDDNLWLDVQVTDQAPAGATYRAWPNMAIPYPKIVTANDQTGYTLALEFTLSQPCSLQRIWHYSPTGVTSDGGNAATALPTRCGIWNAGSQLEVAGTDNSSPTWSGAAGSGWVSCDYTSSGVTLPAGTYKVSTFHGAGANWFGAVANVFGAGNIQAANFTAGPLTIPNNANSSPGQQSWNTVSWAYPATSTNPEADYIDVEVLPVSAVTPTLAMGGRMTSRTAETYRFNA